MSILYILNINSLFDVVSTNIISHQVFCLLVLAHISLAVQNLQVILPSLAVAIIRASFAFG